MDYRNLPRITLEQARALGYVIDYPEHPVGVGTPIGNLYGDDMGTTRSFDYFVVDPRTPVAGWLCKDLGSVYSNHRCAAFLTDRTREDALDAVEDGHVLSCDKRPSCPIDGRVAKGGA